VGWFDRASAIAPEEAVCWLNLAFVCRYAGAADAETRCLERALESAACGYGGLLLTPLAGPYANAWRRTLASGTERIEMLWSQAATRLAQLELDAGRAGRAKDLADRALEWAPDVAEAHRVWAAAAQTSGDPAGAAQMLARGLPYTAFDAEYRRDMVQTLFDAGEVDQARQLALSSAQLFTPCVDGAETAEAFRRMAGGAPSSA